MFLFLFSVEHVLLALPSARTVPREKGANCPANSAIGGDGRRLRSDGRHPFSARRSGAAAAAGRGSITGLTVADLKQTREPPTTEFKGAPMSPMFVVMTGVILAIPVIWAVMIVSVGGEMWKTSLVVIAAFVVLGSAIWLLLRPSGFAIDARAVTIRWPLRTQTLARSRISNARTLDRQTLRRDLGWSARVGVGGLFGTFGLLWTSKRGWVSAYVTTTNSWVLLEREGERPLLVSPERPDEFVRALGRSG